MYHIGFDLGSSSVKVAIVASATGKQLITVSEPRHEMDITAHQLDWAEQDPQLWWEHVCKASQRAISESGIDAALIKGIGISYQMHGLVVVNQCGVPLRDAIIWCDSRAVRIGDTAFEELGRKHCASRLLNTPGNFTASKLKWVQTHEPEIYRKAYKLMLPGDYIAYKLTGVMATTRNGLSEGMLWDYEKNDIAHSLLDYYGIDAALIPIIVDNFSNQGNVHSDASEQSGLPPGIPVRYRAGDQPNNALSLNVLAPGEVAVTGGTSGVVFAVTDHLKPQEIERINNFAHVNYKEKDPVIGKLLCINGAGIQYRWLKNLIGDMTYEAMNEAAAQVPVGADQVVVLPFGNGAERMFYNKTIGSHIAHLNLNRHSKAHLCRAMLEGIAFAFVYGIQLLQGDHTQMNVLRVGNDNLFRSQLFAETIATLIGAPIELYSTTGAIGAARAGSIVNGNFATLGDQLKDYDFIKSYEPLPNVQPYQDAYARWVNELEIKLALK